MFCSSQMYGGGIGVGGSPQHDIGPQQANTAVTAAAMRVVQFTAAGTVQLIQQSGGGTIVSRRRWLKITPNYLQP
jgi:hypothetical protein